MIKEVSFKNRFIETFPIIDNNECTDKIFANQNKCFSIIMQTKELTNEYEYEFQFFYE